MENNKACDMPWRERLDLLAELPGEPVANREAAWQRLHALRQKKPVSKRLFVYWLAAACVLIAISLPRFLQHTPAIQPEQPVAPLSGVHPKQRASQEGQPMVSMDGAGPEKLIKPAHGKASPRSEKEVARSVVAAPVREELPIEAVATAIPRPADTVHAIALLPGPKKLRVVHINELGVPSAESASGRMAGAQYLQARLANPEDFSRFTISHNNSDNILKIKLSPSN